MALVRRDMTIRQSVKILMEPELVNLQTKHVIKSTMASHDAMIQHDKTRFAWSHLQLLALAALLFLGSCAFHLKYARAGTPIYRDQHLSAAVEYSKAKIDLFKPVILGFNATGTPTPQEFPVWQALAGLVMKVMGPWYGWANVVSLLLFATCLLPLYDIAKVFLGARGACWTLVFFLAQPLVFIYTGEACTDGFSLVTQIWFLFCAVKMLRGLEFKWWVPTCVAGTLAALTKLPFMMATGLACFFLLLSWHRKSWRAWLLLGSSGAVMVAIFFVWTAYTNHCIAVAEFPFVDLRLSDPGTKFWYFGDLHYRLSPGNWIKGGWRIFNGCFGSFALAGLFAYGFLLTKRNLVANHLLIGTALTTFIFVHLVLHHTHYYLMFTPVVALVCAQGAVVWETKLVDVDNRWQQHVLFGTLAGVLILSVIQGLSGLKVVLHFDAYPYEMAKIIDQYCAPSDKLLIEGGGWGGNELMLSHRAGMSIWNTKLLENPDTLKRLKELGYNKLVMISDSPLLNAVQMINPGQSQLQRESYRETMTPVVNDWPTLLQNDNILIKQIP